MADREVVHVEYADHILTITMDRPEARNALNRQMMRGRGTPGRARSRLAHHRPQSGRRPGRARGALWSSGGELE